MNAAAFLDMLAGRLDTGEPVVWVTVAATRGSAPREPGARMLVGRDFTADTIGGGNLELRAIAIAREMLADAAAGVARPAQLVRFPLGASVGQCCGGVVQLAFDLVTPQARAWVREAQALEGAGRPWVRLVPLGGEGHPAEGPVAVHDAEALTRADGTAPALRDALRRLAGQGGGDVAALVADAEGDREWILTLTRPPELHVAVFGAGHVGRALVEALGRLPLRVTWVDVRDDEFPGNLPANVEAVCSDVPEAEVRAMPTGTVALVMSHSHALDLELVRAWLDRGDFRFLGLIGSASKRAAFERRLRAQGYRADQLARLVCPIGIPGVEGKEPEVIAVAVAAQVMGLRQARRQASASEPHQAKAAG